MAVDEKSNEITAVPELLDLLDVSGCIVTADALNTQRAIAEKVLSQGADYVLALKGNQGTLHADVELKFSEMRDDLLTKVTGHHHQTIDAEHGRVETRNYWITSDIDFLSEHKWPGLVSLGIAETLLEYKDGRTSKERRFFINSIPADAKLFAKAVRGHWGVEAMHWTLDVTFNEDASRIRKDNAPQNFAALRQIALNLVKATKEKRLSIRTKRKKAGWDESFLLRVLLAGDTSL
jgi:predicted transposase YbfD/YdcC